MDASLFAKHFVQPSGSPIRELFPYLSRPGLISFAGGYPSPSLFDVEGLSQAGSVALGKRGGFQYGPTEGQEELREQLAILCGRRGIDASAEHLMVTTGSQQAFDLLVRVLVEPGDTVLVETPAYPATLQALRLADARVVEVPTDADGIDTEYLAGLLDSLASARRPKLLYTVPNFSNPGGTLLSEARRRRLAGLALTHGFLVVEDDPYGELNFTGRICPSVHQCGAELAGADNPVVYLSSLSKTVAPALRTGWMIAPQALLRRCAIAKQTADLCTSPITQQIAAEYLKMDRYDAAVRHATGEYQRRMARLAEALTQALAGRAHFVRPQGGMFLWLALADHIDGDALFRAAVEENVLFVPGKAFYPAEAPGPAVRLSFAGPALAQISEGVGRLARAFDAVAA